MTKLYALIIDGILGFNVTQNTKKLNINFALIKLFPIFTKLIYKFHSVGSLGKLAVKMINCFCKGVRGAMFGLSKKSMRLIEHSSLQCQLSSCDC
jgi:hypothetical protein